MMLALLGVLVAAFVLRATVTRGAQPGFDVYGHLCFAQAVHAQRSGPFGAVHLPAVGADAYSQPFLWHWLVGMFGVKRLLPHQAWLNAAIDALFAGVAFVAVRAAGVSEAAALGAMALYLLTPMWFSSIAIGPRIAGFTPRLSSEVASNLFFLICLLPLGLDPVVIVLAGGLLAAFVLASSKFGVQAMLFLTPLTVAFGGGLLPLAALAAGLAMTFLLSRGRLARQLAEQVRHLAWYSAQNLRGRMHVSQRNSLRTLLARSEVTLKAYLIKLLHRLLSDNSYTAVLLKMPVLLLALLAIWHGPAGQPLAAPVLAACVLMLVVNLRPFLFLGEAERYLNHIAIAIVVLAAEYVMAVGLNLVLVGLLAYGAVFWAAESFALSKLTPQRFKQRRLEDDRIIADLHQLATPTVVLSFPYHAAGGIFRIGLQTHHRSVYCLCTGAEFAARFNAEYADTYPFVRLDRLEAMAVEYGIGYVVIDRQDLKARGLGDWRPSAAWTRRAVGGDIYDVYQRA